MTEKVTFSGQGAPAGQPVEQPATPPAGEATHENAPAGEQQASPGYVTVEQLRQILAEDRERARRAEQSERAKLENRIKGMVDHQLATLSAAGVQTTPEMEQNIQNVVRQQVTSLEPTPPESASPADARGDPTLIDRAAGAMMEALGVELLDDDPEANMLDRSDEKAYLASLHKALMAKAARSAVSPAARVPATSGGGQAGGAKKAITAELDRLLQNPSRNRQRIRELSAELAKFNSK